MTWPDACLGSIVRLEIAMRHILETCHCARHLRVCSYEPGISIDINDGVDGETPETSRFSLSIKADLNVSGRQCHGGLFRDNAGESPGGVGGRLAHPCLSARDTLAWVDPHRPSHLVGKIVNPHVSSVCTSFVIVAV